MKKLLFTLLFLFILIPSGIFAGIDEGDVPITKPPSKPPVETGLKPFIAISSPGSTRSYAMNQLVPIEFKIIWNADKSSSDIRYIRHTSTSSTLVSGSRNKDIDTFKTTISAEKLMDGEGTGSGIIFARNKNGTAKNAEKAINYYAYFRNHYLLKK